MSLLILESFPRWRVKALLDHFADIDDPREGWRVAFRLPEVLLVVCGTICDCEDHDEIAEWGDTHRDVLRRYAPYHYGVPSGRWLTLLMNRVRGRTELKDRCRFDTRYYVSSAPLTAKAAGDAVRGHWMIENSLHWVLDVVFAEDQSRLRKGHGAHNMAVVRHSALNLIRTAPDIPRQPRSPLKRGPRPASTPRPASLKLWAQNGKLEQPVHAGRPRHQIPSTRMRSPVVV